MAIKIKEIGIVGAGQMGSGITHVFTLKGYKVFLNDVDEAALEKAIGSIDRNMSRQVSRGKITEVQKNDAIGLITTSTAYDGFATCDLIIEAASEIEKLKKDILKKLCSVIKPEAIIASNTSSISITRLGAIMDNPGNFMGMHFMNPVPMMDLVELIRGIATDPETFETIRQLAHTLDKTPVSSEDFPAFLVNRILLPMVNEAIYTLYEGVGSVSAIDTAMKLGTNHPMGPLELADFIGLVICLAVMNVLHEGLADTKYRPCPLLVKYVEAGWLGRKTGRGFYDYAGETPVPTR
jgi:3-hydroxybutyryl-CoA dehydrogenase